MTEETGFTLFWSDGYQPTDDLVEAGELPKGHSLQQAIDVLVAEFGAPDSWMVGCPRLRFDDWKASREESIAAGRTIDLDILTYRYVARGVEDKPAKRPHGSVLGDLVHMGGREYVRNGAGFVWYRDMAEGERPPSCPIPTPK
jgi:hypothetical protein